MNLVVVSEKEEILEGTGQETAHVREEDDPNHQDNVHVEAVLVHQRKIDHWEESDLYTGMFHHQVCLHFTTEVGINCYELKNWTELKSKPWNPGIDHNLLINIIPFRIFIIWSFML